MSPESTRKPYAPPILRDLGSMRLVEKKSFIKGDKGRDWTTGEKTKH